MKCSSSIDVGKTLHCCLKDGHEGAHQADDGFPWEDNPTVYISPIWVCRGAEVRNGENTFLIQSYRAGSSKDSSSVGLIDENTGEELTIPMEVFLEDYQFIAYRGVLAPDRIKFNKHYKV